MVSFQFKLKTKQRSGEGRQDEVVAGEEHDEGHHLELDGWREPITPLISALWVAS